MCGAALETWEHIWEECMVREGGSIWQENEGKILGEEGEGEEWLRELKKIRGNGGANGVRSGYES